MSRLVYFDGIESHDVSPLIDQLCIDIKQESEMERHCIVHGVKYYQSLDMNSKDETGGYEYYNDIVPYFIHKKLTDNEKPEKYSLILFLFIVMDDTESIETIRTLVKDTYKNYENASIKIYYICVNNSSIYMTEFVDDIFFDKTLINTLRKYNCLLFLEKYPFNNGHQYIEESRISYDDDNIQCDISLSYFKCGKYDMTKVPLKIYVDDGILKYSPKYSEIKDAYPNVWKRIHEGKIMRLKKHVELIKNISKEEKDITLISEKESLLHSCAEILHWSYYDIVNAACFSYHKNLITMNTLVIIMIDAFNYIGELLFPDDHMVIVFPDDVDTDVDLMIQALDDVIEGYSSIEL